VPGPCVRARDMKLHLAGTAGLNLFTSYGEDFVSVNGQRHSVSLIVLRDRLIVPWEPASFDQIRAEHVASVAPLGCDIVILGTGPTQRFPSAPVMAPLIEARIGFEVMSTQAACRTYNILAAEDRKVAAVLVLR
jgi:uncharacterized protein